MAPDHLAFPFPLPFPLSLALTTLSTTACPARDPLPSPPDRCEAPCDIATHGCLHSGECPAGTRCAPTLPLPDAPCNAPLPDRDATYSCAGCERAGADTDTECVVAGPYLPDRRALTAFGAPSRISLDRIGESTAYRVTAPVGSRSVACALFSCAPEIDLRVDPPAFANYGACVLADRVASRPDPTFDPANAYNHEVDLLAAPAACRPPDAAAIVTQLLIGCWSYDDTSLNAVSDLIAVSPASAPGLVVACAGPETNGRSCALGGNAYGLCRAGVCATRCVSDADCGEFSCDPIDGGYLGLCGSSPSL